MKRKGLLALFAGIYVTLVLAALPPMGAGAPAPLTKVHWDLNIYGSPRQWTAGVDKFVALIAERTKGNFVIEKHYGAPLSPPKENLDALRAGAFEAAVVMPSYHPGKTPLWNATALPFMKDVEDPYVCGYMGMKMYEEFDSAKKELAAFNVRLIYPLGQSATVAIGNKALRKVEDFKGVRFRALGLHCDAAKAMGATPMTVPAPEVFEALDKKVIDIAAMNASSLVMGYNLHEISKYLHTWPLGNTLGLLVCSENAYRALSKEYQKVMDEAWEDALLWHRKVWIAEADVAYEKARKAGVEIVEISDAEYARMVAIGGKPIWDTWAANQEAKGLPGRDLINFIVKKANEGKKELAKKTK